MAKAMTKSQIAEHLAKKVEIKKSQAVAVLDEIAKLSYKEAKNSFTLPGVGKIVLVQRKARMGRNPQTGASIKIPSKKVVKFRVAKAAKDAILERSKAIFFVATFSEVLYHLETSGPVRLPYATNPRVVFEATADKCQRGKRAGQPIIRVRSGRQTNILIYEQDWGNKYTTGGTLIAHIYEALNPFINNQL